MRAAEGTEPGGTVASAVPRWTESCPRCGTPRDGQFCENCGYNFAAPASAQNQAAPAPPSPSPATQLPVTQAAAAGAASAPVPDAQIPGPQVPYAGAAGAEITDPQATFDPAGHFRPARARRCRAWQCRASAGSVATGSAAPGPAAPACAAWTAVVSADRAYYDSIQAAGGPDAAGIEFPAYCPQRRFTLDRAEVRIGRHSASSGISPEIDLSVAPADPGISRLHAVLLRAADGSWSIVDPGSANGTLLNGTELATGQVVPVHDGDRIHLGAWTELRLTSGA